MYKWVATFFMKISLNTAIIIISVQSHIFSSNNLHFLFLNWLRLFLNKNKIDFLVKVCKQAT